MDLTFWILTTPLAAAWGFILWRLLRDGDLWLALPGVALPLLAVRHVVDPPPPSGDLLALLMAEQLAPSVIDLLSNLAASATAVVFARTLRERDRAEQEQWTSMEVLRRLTDLLGSELLESGSSQQRDSEPSALDEQEARSLRLERGAERLLELGCRELGMEIGVITIHHRTRESGETGETGEGVESEITNLCGPEDCGLAVGERAGLETTFCAAAVPLRGPFCIESTAGGPWSGHPARETHHLESYIGMAIRDESEVLGTVYFASREPRVRSFTRAEKTLLEVSAHWLSAELRQHRSTSDQRDLSRLQAVALDLTRLALEDRPANEFLQMAAERIAATLSLYRVEIRASGVDGAAGGRKLVASGPGAAGPAQAEICFAVERAGVELGSLAVATSPGRELAPKEREFLELCANLVAPAVGGEGRTRTVGSEAVPRRSGEYPRRRLDLHWAVGRLTRELAETSDEPVAIDLVLASEAIQLPLYRYELDRVVESLVRHADRTTASEALRIETRAVAPPSAVTAAAAGSGARYAELSVHAEGPALNAEQLAELYVEGEDGRNPLPDAPLSLPNIERLLRAAGGDLSVHSEAGRGTVFTAYFALERRP